MIDLLNYKKNVFSQFGEDGIIEYLNKILEIESGYFVEFGAWDGKYCSNTFNLLQKDWNGLFIEGDTSRFQQLIENTKDFSKNVVCVNKFVEELGPNSLTNILKENNVKFDFELLSIDIDGFDYQIWDSLIDFRPKVVIIEINSAIPEGEEQIHNPPYLSSSFTSMVKLGESKGYTPVCHTGNIFFIESSLCKEEFNFYFIKDWIGNYKNPYKLI